MKQLALVVSNDHVGTVMAGPAFVCASEQQRDFWLGSPARLLAKRGQARVARPKD